MIYLRCPQCQSTNMELHLDGIICKDCGQFWRLYEVHWMNMHEPKKELLHGQETIDSQAASNRG